MTAIEKKTVKRTGRPPKNPELGKRINVMFRLNEARRDQLMRDAEQNGRSMSEEIEYRLDRSYADIDLLVSYFGTSEALRLSNAVSLIIRAVEADQNAKWTEDLQTRSYVLSALERFLDIYFREQGGPDFPSTLASLGETNPGHNAAEQVAQFMGLRSKVRERLEAFLKTPEGQAAWAKANQG